MPQDYDVAIIGAGMVGQACACLLKQKTPYRIVLIDPAPHQLLLNQQFSSRVSAISAHSLALLESIGVWAGLYRHYGFSKIKVWDKIHQAQISFDAKTQGNAKTQSDAGTPGGDYLGYVVENQQLQYALRQQVIALAVDYLAQSLVVLTKTDNGYQLKLDSTTIFTGLVIAADGANSPLRAHLKIPLQRFDYGQKALIALLASTQPFSESIYQWFSQQGIIAILPITEKICTLVWSLPQQEADELMASTDILVAQLNRAIDDYFGQLSLLGQVETFVLKQQNAKYYVGHNFALIGDAAHQIHPLAGQGVNLGFLDAVALADVLEKAGQKGKTPGNYRQLKLYEKARQLDDLLASNLMTGFYYLDKINQAPLNYLINRGITWLDKNTTLKNQLSSMVLKGCTRSL